MIKSFYLAAPFFTPAQVTLVARLEVTIRAAGFELFSPRESGLILKNMTAAERQAAAPKVFNDNIGGIINNDAILAVIDDRDPGVMIEIGIGYIRNKNIYTYTDFSYGLNVMIQGCSSGHACGIDMLRDMLAVIKEGKSTKEFRVDAAT